MQWDWIKFERLHWYEQYLNQKACKDNFGKISPNNDTKVTNYTAVQITIKPVIIQLYDILNELAINQWIVGKNIF